MSTSFKGSFYDADYYENGRKSGKGWLENYHWMPVRSFKEALAYVDFLGLTDKDRVLDLGCAKGFIVRALRELDIFATGCDISSYALSFAPTGCWNCEDPNSWQEHRDRYTHVICKDVLEHLTKEQLPLMLHNLSLVAPVFMCVVPLGDKGKYRIPEYHTEISHLIAEDEEWWKDAFAQNGWQMIKGSFHVPGLKDNWQDKADGKGNYVFVLQYTGA